MTRLVIKTHPSWKVRLAQVGAVIGVLLTGWGLFEYGRYSAGYDTVSNAREQIEHVLETRGLEQSVTDLREQKAVLEQASRIDHEAYAQLEGEMAGLRNEIMELNKELEFYRGIVSPQGGSGVMRLQRFEVSHSGIERGFHYQLVLTQAFTNSGITTGSVTFSVEGTMGQTPKSFSLAELTDNKVKELPFRFKYFQEIGGDLVLPAGFVPKRVVVNVAPNSGEKLQNAYDWPV